MKSLIYTIIVLVFSVFYFGCSGGKSDTSSTTIQPTTTSSTVTTTTTTTTSSTTTTTLQPAMLLGSLNVLGYYEGSRTNSAARMKPKDLPTQGSQEADFIVGEIIVRFKEDVSAKELAEFFEKHKNIGIRNTGELYPGGPNILRTNAYQNKAMSQDEAKDHTKNTAKELGKEVIIKYAELNHISRTRLFPNDTAFDLSLQWPLRLIGMPIA